ncbi:PH domain-containing protein [Streptomyces sp. Agncl-13]|uniref:PH domain-containing protein n=1 Tax=Streptomyces sp. Agncl-13 TaxID=3400628 RepID=UPI003A886EE6
MGGDDEDDRDDERGIEREYSRRRKMSRGRFAGLCIVEANFALQMARPDSIPGRYRLLAVALMVMLGVWAFLAVRRGLTSVGADGIAVRGAFRVRKRDWHDIYDLRVERRNTKNADARLLTWLYDNDGRRLPLTNVDDWQLPDVRAEVEELRTAAAQHRGMAWELRPEVEDRIGLRAVRRKAQERAAVGAMLVFFAAIGYLVWEVSADGGHRLFAFLLLLWAPLAAYALLVTLFRLRSSRSPAHA